MDALQETNGTAAEMAEILALWRSARDALSDDIVTRLGATLGDGLDLLDRANRADLGRLIPALAQLLDSGDLERLIALARLVGSMQDALSDDIVTRLGALAANGMVLLERVAEHEAVPVVFAALDEARAETAQMPRSRGGIGGLWEIMKNPETQDTLRFLLLFVSRFRRRLGA